MAANALMVSYLHDSFHSKLLYNLRTEYLSCSCAFQIHDSFHSKLLYNNLRTEYLSCSCAFQIFVSIVNGRPGVFQPSRVLLVSHVLKWFSIPVVMVFVETVVEAKAVAVVVVACVVCVVDYLRLVPCTYY